jgi:hypothetical protein
MTVTAQGIGTRVAHDPGDPLITSHCPFCGSGQVVGRSDGTIGCDFCGQNYIVRVQPAFPGMPQMPNGPGAPSDVGPDGGLVDPGMVGPDGMPVDGGMPPDMPPGAGEDGEAPPPGDGEDEEEGPPVDAAGEGESGPPPPAGDSKKNSNGKKPPPKGKDKGPGKKKPPPKKASQAVYRGLGGHPLNEDQFIRHMAVALSGAHPAVMARLRNDSALPGGRR